MVYIEVLSPSFAAWSQSQALYKPHTQQLIDFPAIQLSTGRKIALRLMLGLTALATLVETVALALFTLIVSLGTCCVSLKTKAGSLLLTAQETLFFELKERMGLFKGVKIAWYNPEYVLIA